MHDRPPDITNHRCPSSALAVAEKVFSLMQSGPAPLSLAPGDLRVDIPPADLPDPGVVLGGDGPVSLWSLRELVVRRDLPVAVINRMWMLLLARSRAGAHRESWTVGAVGMALPALCALASALSGPLSGPRWRDGVDLDAEILSGFLSGLAAARPDSPGLFPFLMRQARNAGLAWVTAQRAAARALPVDHTTLEGLIGADHPRGAHPDQVLTELVAAGVLSIDDAELILATRLEGIPARRVAAAAKVPYDTLRKRRLRAEHRVAVYLGGHVESELGDRASLDRRPGRCAAPGGHRVAGDRRGHSVGHCRGGGLNAAWSRSRGVTR